MENDSNAELNKDNCGPVPVPPFHRQFSHTGITHHTWESDTLTRPLVGPDGRQTSTGQIQLWTAALGNLWLTLTL